MNDRPLLRHLTLVVLVKLAVLAGLWWVFFRPAQVPVNPDTAAEHVTSVPSPAAPQGVRP